MHFHRYKSRHVKRELTPLKIAAARRAVQREIDSIPLFPEMARYQTVNDRLNEINDTSIAFVNRMRIFQASAWRRARSKLRAMPPELRAKIIAHWNMPIYPANPTYLLDLIHNIQTGQFDIDQYHADLARVRTIGEQWRASPSHPVSH